MEILYYIFWVTVGFSIGWYLSYSWTMYKAEKVLKQYLAQEEKIIKNSILYLRMEQSENVYYFYDKSNDSFICSAYNKQELMDYVARRFPDKYVYLDNKDMKQLENS